MTLKSSGSLSLTEIQSEFGGSAPIGLNEYRQGGDYVYTGTTNAWGRQTPGSSGSISMYEYYGSTKVPSSLPVRVLLVGGGGGGGVRYGWDNAQYNGGGGAGGFLDVSFNLSRGSYPINIGSGGWYGYTLDRETTSGGDTTGFGYTAYGGGHGGGSDGGVGVSGGSGGGGPGGGAEGISGQGNAGWAGGGGAGYASGYGLASNSGHNGGPGAQWIDGIYYAGGGSSSSGTTLIPGGGGYSHYTNVAQYDQYGRFSYYAYVWDGTGFPYGGNHATYYGGGGQGGATKFGGQGYGFEGGAGYQGILIITYQWNFQLLSGGYVTDDGGSGLSKRWFHKFTSSGTCTY